MCANLYALRSIMEYARAYGYIYTAYILPERWQCGSMVPFILNCCTREQESRRKNAALAILLPARESINFFLRKEIARKTPDTYFNLFQFVELNKYGLTVWHNWISIATVWQHEKWTNRIYFSQPSQCFGFLRWFSFSIQFHRSISAVLLFIVQSMLSARFIHLLSPRYCSTLDDLQSPVYMYFCFGCESP